MTSLPLFKDLDPSVQEQLDLKTFQVGTSVAMAHLHANTINRESSRSRTSLARYQRSLFHLHKQVQSVCRFACSHFIPTLTRARTAFNPVPFIRTFEATVDRLLALRKDVQIKTEQTEKSVRVAEREYSRKMSDLNKGFEVRCSYDFELANADTYIVSWSIFRWYGEQNERSGAYCYPNWYDT